ncbi:MAG: AI-2E family transporter [Solirubrobacterales bacterium]|nr:AI-2E family transporter [Solirubrobacterales bacterium]MCB8915142.1 AI-2E family transporter [Thermoleophilales bacterium]
MIRGRIRRGEGESAETSADQVIEIDAGELSNVFAVPTWLRNAGLGAWFLVGIAILLLALVWLASLTEVIVVPVIVASIVGAVGSPLVSKMNGHGLPRGIGAILVMLLLILIGAGCAVMVVNGIVREVPEISRDLNQATDDLSQFLTDQGIDKEQVEKAKEGAKEGATSSIGTLLSGLLSGIAGISSAFFFLAMVLLSSFFMLKDGPSIRGWAERASSLPPQVARIVSGRMIASLRGYFAGVTIVAAFGAVVVMIGALIIGVPLVGTIGAVTFIAGYVPYLGAWTAGIFTVLLAYGSGGTDAAIGMAVVQLLANGILQQMVQPFAMGSTLGIHPLAVLVVTIAGGALFGSIGLIIAAPLVAAAAGVVTDLKSAEEKSEDRSAGNEGPGVEPTAAPT